MSEDYKQKLIDALDNGYNEWRMFCDLMEEYPGDTYEQLLLRLEINKNG